MIQCETRGAGSPVASVNKLLFGHRTDKSQEHSVNTKKLNN